MTSGSQTGLLKHRYFGFLEKTVNVLIVDDTPHVLESLGAILGEITLFQIYTAASAREAVALMNERPRKHLVAMDLGLFDIENDEYAVVRKHCHSHYIIVITGQCDSEKGAQSILLGAKGVIHKPLELLEIVPRLNEHLLRSIISPRGVIDPGSLIERAVEILLREHPPSVSEWARSLGVTESGLWKACDEYLGVAAKHVIIAYHAYKTACAYYSLRLRAPDQDELPVPQKEYEWLRERYTANREAILDLLEPSRCLCLPSRMAVA